MYTCFAVNDFGLCRYCSRLRESQTIGRLRRCVLPTKSGWSFLVGPKRSLVHFLATAHSFILYVMYTRLITWLVRCSCSYQRLSAVRLIRPKFCAKTPQTNRCWADSRRTSKLDGAVPMPDESLSRCPLAQGGFGDGLDQGPGCAPLFVFFLAGGDMAIPTQRPQCSRTDNHMTPNCDSVQDGAIFLRPR